jgi:pimeloyl-ACP methyl ester carboxylesterase
MLQIRRQFVDGSFGQIHVRIARPAEVLHRPLACLHMSPKSGRIYAQFLERAATDRIVIAHDYPGFGESDPPPPTPPVTIEDYATSLWEVVDAVQLGTIDVLGYHTGSEVAAEAARQRPGQVGNIVMIGAPVFTVDELEQMRATYAAIPLDIDATRFQEMWKSVVAHRGPGMTLEMMAVSFAENLRSGDAYEWGHRAAFNYVAKFPDVVKTLPHRITVFNLGDDLAQCTPRIAPYLMNGAIIDHSEWGHGFLDAYSDAAAAAIKSALE